MDTRVEVDDARLRGELLRLIALGRQPGPVMGDLAALGESQTRERFRTQVGPDGIPWITSLRARLSGGRTLTKDGHLGDSLSSAHGRDWAEWGVNRLYADIHQFGGVIRPASKKALKFRLATGAWVTLRAVRIPPRPYLGVSNADGQDMLDAIARRIVGGAHAG